MNSQLPRTVRCNIDRITVEICHGEIPDVCRLLNFDPITEFELPDAKATDKEFTGWLSLYSHETYFREESLMKETLCG